MQRLRMPANQDGYNKIFLHTASPSNMNGWGPLVRECDAAGIPVGVMSVGGEGIGDIVGVWENGSTVPHVPVVRFMPSDGSQDVPPYGSEIGVTAPIWWQEQKHYMSQGPEYFLYNDRIVFKQGNELARIHSDWLGAFFSEVGRLAVADPDGPFRIAPFGFSSGTPEKAHWKTPGMQEYLTLAHNDPHHFLVCLHEYSYNISDIYDGYPYKIGRFHLLHEACTEMGLNWPDIVIHEWGWELGNIPGPTDALRDIDEIGELYAYYPNILFAGVWTCQPFQGSGIQNKVAAIIPDIKEHTLVARYEVGPGSPTTPPIEPPPIDPPIEPPVDPPTEVRGIRLDRYEIKHEDCGFRIHDRLPFHMRFENVTESPVQYGGMGAMITRWDGQHEVPYYWQQSYGGPNAKLNPGYGPGSDEGWDDSWKANELGTFAMYIFLTFDPTAYQKSNHPATIHDGHLMTEPFWFTIGSLLEPGGPIESPVPPVEPPVEPPIDPPPDGEKHKVVVWKKAQEHTRANWETFGGGAHDEYKRTTTASLDDSVTMYMAGNDESYVVLWDPGLPSQVQAKAYYDEHAIRYEERWAFTTPGGPDPEPPEGEFMYEIWPTDGEHLVTQPFGANPEYYDQFGYPGHEGIDLRSPLSTPYFCPYPGTITRCRDTRSDGQPSAYGWHIIIDHGNGYTTLLAHMEAEPLVNVGETVLTGQIVGYSGNTGNSSGPHMHLTLKKEGYVHPGWECCPGYIDPWPFLQHLYQQQPPPPSGDRYDMVDYMAPLSEYGGLYEVETKVNGNPSGQQRHQSQRPGMGNEFYHTKGGDGPAHHSEWEQLNITGEFIQRGIDTSPSPETYYTLTDANGAPWINWLKRYIAVGEVTVSHPRVTNYRKADCGKIDGPTATTDYIKFVAFHQQWEGYNGIVLSNVVELAWSKTPDFSRVEERYFYSRDDRAPGLVGWGNERDGRWALVSELHSPGSRPNNVRMSGCFG